MPQETTILLVDAHHFHVTLEEQLSARQVYVEHASASEAVQVASVLVPDLVVLSGQSEVSALVQGMSQARPPLPTIVVADRAQVKKWRTDDLPLAALVPRDLPIAAIAHRIATMARKSAQGALPLRAPRGIESSLGQQKSVKPSSVPPPSPAAKPIKTTLTKPLKNRLDQPESPNSASKIPPAPVTFRPEASMRPTLIGAAAAPPIEGTLDPSPLPPLTVPRLVPFDLSTQSQRPGKFVPVPLADLAADSVALSESSVPRPTLPPKPFQGSTRRGKTADRLIPAAIHFPPASESLSQSPPSDELSVVAQFPIDLRLPLSTTKKQLLALRLAYLDVDLTRADRLTGAMRRKGLEVFPLTPDVEQTRWPLLRRFAPQAMIVDEKGMARDSSAWVETFRGDPFLRHVPLVVVRLSRLYHEEDESIDLDPLLTLIEHMGQDEAALLQKLAPGRQVDLKLSQIGPVRLVQILTAQDRNTRIDCRSGRDRIVWPLGPGYTGKAKLLSLGSEKVLAKLDPSEAMSWLLRFEDVDIAVHEHSEPLAHASESLDSTQLLRNVTDALGIPDRHQSVRPAVFRGQNAAAEAASARLGRPSVAAPPTHPAPPTIPAPASFPTSLAPNVEDNELIFASELAPPFDSNLVESIPSSASEVRFSPTLSSTTTASALSSDSHRSSASIARIDLKGRTAQLIRSKYCAYQQLLAQVAAHLPVSTRRYLAPGLLALFLGLLLGLIILWLRQNTTIEPAAVAVELPHNKAALAEATRQGTQSQPATPPPKQAESAQLSELSVPVKALWAIAKDSKRPSCEAVVGGRKPTSLSKPNAQKYLRQARQLLMVGQTEDALELMCLSALNDEAGGAPESLAEYYLGRRALSEAERWIQSSLRTDPARRKSQELLADIENQKGNWEESRSILLRTMKLTGNESSTLNAIGRKLLADARHAVKGGDLARAERDLRRAAVLVPTSGGIALELARVLGDREMTAAALLWYDHAYRLDPTGSDALLFAGNLAAQSGDSETARKYYSRVPPGDSLYPKAKRRLSELPN